MWLCRMGGVRLDVCGVVCGVPCPRTYARMGFWTAHMPKKPYTAAELENKRRRVQTKVPAPELLVIEEKPKKKRRKHAYTPSIPQNEWDALRSAVMVRDSLICVSCSAWANLGVHHTNFDKTDNDPNNLETLCWRCHTKKHHRAGIWGHKKRSAL